jgi:hypothetical protein
MPKCKFCKAPATLKIQMANFCSVDCAYQHARKLQDQARKRKEQKAKRLHQEKKKALKTRQEWLKEAQAVFNKYIRIRDEKEPCISCGRHHQGQYHAGHYLTVGACPELRFEELNVHKQCSPCNNHLSGNLVNYRIRLIDKIGLDKVEWLEGTHEPLKLTIPEIQSLIAEYKAKIKAITHPTTYR